MPSTYNPFFMSRLLQEAEDNAPTGWKPSDIGQGFLRGVNNEMLRQSKPSQGLTNFVGYASLGFKDTLTDFRNGLNMAGEYLSDQYKDFSRAANVGNSIPLDAGVLPMGDGAYVPATSNEIRAFNYVTNYPFNQQSAAPETGYQITAPSRAGMLNQQAQPAMSQTLTTMEPARVAQPPKQQAQKSKPTLSKADADELSKIRLHSAIPSQNMFSISDASGNRGWAGVGDKVNGWSVKSYDKGFVTVEKNGVTAKVGLQGSSPTEYVPSERERAVGAGTMSSYDQDPSSQLSIEGFSPNELQKYKIQRDMFENIRRNSMLSPHMSDEDKKRIMHFNDYQHNLRNLESGKRYFIPRMDNNGNVDMDVFVPQ